MRPACSCAGGVQCCEHTSRSADTGLRALLGREGQPEEVARPSQPKPPPFETMPNEASISIFSI